MSSRPSQRTADLSGAPSGRMLKDDLDEGLPFGELCEDTAAETCAVSLWGLNVLGGLQLRQPMRRRNLSRAPRR